VSRLHDRESGARSAALTPVGHRLLSCYPGKVILRLELHADANSLTNFMDMGGLVLYRW
jgi:hypothetical protein